MYWRRDDMAFVIMLMFTTYCRPGEIRSLKARQVLRQARLRISG